MIDFLFSYEEKLKELKKTATFKEEQDKMLRKEVNIEINKIQRSMRKQFQTEFQTFLNKIESKAENRRLIKYPAIIHLFFQILLLTSISNSGRKRQLN